MYQVHRHIKATPSQLNSACCSSVSSHSSAVFWSLPVDAVQKSKFNGQADDATKRKKGKYFFLKMSCFLLRKLRTVSLNCSFCLAKQRLVPA